MGKLTALGVKNERKPGKHGDGGGLYLNIRESGSRAWELRVQVNGVRRDVGLGSADTVSLKEARETAEEMRKLARAGIDPLLARQQAAAEAKRIPTFREAAEAAHEELRPTWANGKHDGQWISTIRRYAYPVMGDMLVSEVDAGAILNVLRPIWQTKYETASRVRQRIGTILDTAFAQGFRPNEAPMRAVSRGLPRRTKSVRHHPAMPYADLPVFYEQLAGSSVLSRMTLRFVILTAARSGEVRSATWKEIDLKARLWTVPAARMKAKKEHVVPLTAEAVTLLEQVAAFGNAPDDLLFPSSRKKPQSDMTLLKALKSEASDDLTVHGFRSSFRDWAAEQTDHPADVIETALAHTISDKTIKAYKRTNFLDRRRTLMEDWTAFLTGAKPAEA